MPNCINCNTDLHENEKFCPICGQIQTSETIAEEPIPSTPEPTAPSQPSQGTYPPPQGSYPPPQGAYYPPPQQGAYPPPYGQPYYPPPVLNGNAGAMLVWGIINIVLSVFCCFILNLVPAIIAVVFANKAKSSYNQFDYDKSAKTALILNIVSSALTLLAIIFFICLAATGNMHFNSYSNVT